MPDGHGGREKTIWIQFHTHPRSVWSRASPLALNWATAILGPPAAPPT